MCVKEEEEESEDSLHYAVEIVGEGAGSFSSQIFILFLKFIF